MVEMKNSTNYMRYEHYIVVVLIWFRTYTRCDLKFHNEIYLFTLHVSV
jgi:hypothetical protein